MRYRIGDTPAQLGQPVGEGMVIAAAVLSTVLGIGFILAGLRSRHHWMTIWGSGLTLSSIACLAWFATR